MHLGQEPDGDGHRIGDPPGGQEPVVRPAGQGQHRAHGVVAALGELEAHRPSMRGAGRFRRAWG